MNTTQTQLPLTVHETRQARLARIAATVDSKLLRPANAFDFNTAAAKRAEAIARGEARGAIVFQEP